MTPPALPSETMLIPPPPPGPTLARHGTRHGTRPFANPAAGWIFLCSLLPFLLLCAGCADDVEPGPSPAPGPRTVPVLVEEVDEARWQWQADRIALAEHARERTLRAPASGRVTLLSEEGELAGAQLARIDAEETRARIAALRRQLETETLRIERYEALHQEGVLTTEEWIEAHRWFESLRREVESAEATARTHRLSAGPDTFVERWHVASGDQVSAGDLLASLRGTSRSLVRLHVSPLEVERWRDAALSLRCAAHDDRLPAQGRLTRDPIPELAGWWIEIPLDPDHPCAREGTRVHVHASASESERLLRVPPRSVAHDHDRSWLWTLDDDDTLRRVQVQVVRALDGGLGVRADLPVGARIVSEDPRSLEAGDLVSALSSR